MSGFWHHVTAVTTCHIHNVTAVTVTEVTF